MRGKRGCSKRGMELEATRLIYIGRSWLRRQAEMTAAIKFGSVQPQDAENVRIRCKFGRPI